MRETATWLKDQAKAYGQTKMNWPMEAQPKPICLPIRFLDDQDFNDLNAYMRAFLDGDVEAAGKALQRLDSPRQPKERLPRPDERPIDFTFKTIQ